MTRWTISLLALISGLGCKFRSKETEAVPLSRPQVASGALTEETAARFLAATGDTFVSLTSSAFDAAALMRLADEIGKPSERALMLVEDENCETSRGNTSDADDDGLPEGPLITTYDCTIKQGNGTYSVSGTETLQDRDDHKALGGLAVRIDGYEARSESVQENRRKSDLNRLDAQFSIKVQDKTLLSDHSLRYLHEIKMDGKPEPSEESSYFLRATWQPTAFSTQDPKSLDQGILSFGGFITLRDDRLNHTVAVTSSPLHLDRTKCPQSSAPYTEGMITLQDGAGQSLVLAYQDCVETISFGGKNITAKVVAARRAATP